MARTGAYLFTEEAGTYSGMLEFRHRTVNHRQGEHGRGSVHTNGIESFWALFDRSCMGTYHSMRPQHLHRYATELEGCYNDRVSPPLERMAHLVGGMEGRWLTCWELISDAELEH